MDVNDIRVVIDTDTTAAVAALETMLGVRKELATQLAPNGFGIGCLDEFGPRAETRMSRDECIEMLAADFVKSFDAACIEHSLKALKVRVLLDEAVS